MRTPQPATAAPAAKEAARPDPITPPRTPPVRPRPHQWTPPRTTSASPARPFDLSAGSSAASSRLSPSLPSPGHFELGRPPRRRGPSPALEGAYGYFGLPSTPDSPDEMFRGRTPSSDAGLGSLGTPLFAAGRGRHSFEGRSPFMPLEPRLLPPLLGSDAFGAHSPTEDGASNELRLLPSLLDEDSTAAPGEEARAQGPTPVRPRLLPSPVAPEFGMAPAGASSTPALTTAMLNMTFGITLSPHVPAAACVEQWVAPAAGGTAEACDAALPELPAELWAHIRSFLPAESLARTCAVSRSWHAAARDPLLPYLREKLMHRLLDNFGAQRAREPAQAIAKRQLAAHFAGLPPGRTVAEGAFFAGRLKELWQLAVVGGNAPSAERRVALVGAYGSLTDKPSLLPNKLSSFLLALHREMQERSASYAGVAAAFVAPLAELPTRHSGNTLAQFLPRHGAHERDAFGAPAAADGHHPFGLLWATFAALDAEVTPDELLRWLRQETGARAVVRNGFAPVVAVRNLQTLFDSLGRYAGRRPEPELELVSPQDRRRYELLLNEGYRLWDFVPRTIAPQIFAKVRDVDGAAYVLRMLAVQCAITMSDDDVAAWQLPETAEARKYRALLATLGPRTWHVAPEPTGGFAQVRNFLPPRDRRPRTDARAW